MEKARTGYKLDLVQHGAGRDLVLLHSLLTDRDAFRLIVPDLADCYRVTLPNLPGFGASPLWASSIDEVAQHVAEGLAARGVTRPFHLLGNGYGGFVALSLARQYPQRVTRLVLLDTAAAFPDQGRQAFRRMQSLVSENGMNAVLDIALQRLFPSEFLEDNPVLVGEQRKVLMHLDPKNFAALCQHLVDVDLRPGLADVIIPTQVVVGLEDAATPPPLSRELCNLLPHSRLVEIPGCGHAPHLQQPERILRLLLRFLDEES